MSLNQVI